MGCVKPYIQSAKQVVAQFFKYRGYISISDWLGSFQKADDRQMTDDGGLDTGFCNNRALKRHTRLGKCYISRSS